MGKKEQTALFEKEPYSIHVTGRHLHVTDAMKAYAIEKIQKMERFSELISDVHVMMDIQKLEHRIDIVMSVNGTKVKSHAATPDMYSSIDQAVDKLKSQVRRYSSRLRDHHAKPLDESLLSVEVIRPWTEEEEVAALNESLEADELRRQVESFIPHRVLKEKTIPMPTLSLSEAMMKMDLSKDSFLLFRNEADQVIYLIYRREEGEYGLLIPNAPR